MQECSQVNDANKLIEYLKTADTKVLAACHTTNTLGKILLQVPWVPTIEKSTATNAFLTKTPEEIYNSYDAPVMDALFTFASKVR